MKRQITYIRERRTPLEAAKEFIQEVFLRSLYVTTIEKQALSQAGRNYENGDYYIADRIIDKNDGKEKTVFVRLQVTDIIAVETTTHR